MLMNIRLIADDIDHKRGSSVSHTRGGSIVTLNGDMDHVVIDIAVNYVLSDRQRLDIG